MSAPVRVGVNLAWLRPDEVGGSEQSVTRLLRAVGELDPPGMTLVLVVGSDFADAHPDLVERFETHVLHGAGRSPVRRVIAEYAFLPRIVRRASIDLWHDAGGTAPGTLPCPRVVTIHDIQPLERPDLFPRMRVRYLRWALPRVIETAAAIAVPSNFVRDRLVAVLDADAARVHVVPWPVPPHVEPAPIDNIRAHFGIIGRILLLPAITYPHKGHVVAIRAMRHLAERYPETTLVLTGGVGPAENDVLAEIRSCGLEDRVVRTGRVSDAVLAALFEHASALIFPSDYEGFGNPILEAMSLGVPVVVADAGAAPEIVGDGGAIIPPGDEAQLALELHRLLGDDLWRAAKIQAGHARAAAFSPAHSAEALVATYRSVLAPL